MYYYFSVGYEGIYQFAKTKTANENASPPVSSFVSCFHLLLCFFLTNFVLLSFSEFQSSLWGGENMFQGFYYTINKWKNQWYKSRRHASLSPLNSSKTSHRYYMPHRTSPAWAKWSRISASKFCFDKIGNSYFKIFKYFEARRCIYGKESLIRLKYGFWFLFSCTYRQMWSSLVIYFRSCFFFLVF